MYLNIDIDGYTSYDRLSRIWYIWLWFSYMFIWHVLQSRILKPWWLFSHLIYMKYKERVYIRCSSLKEIIKWVPKIIKYLFDRFTATTYYLLHHMHLTWKINVPLFPYGEYTSHSIKLLFDTWIHLRHKNLIVGRKVAWFRKLFSVLGRNSRNIDYNHMENTRGIHLKYYAMKRWYAIKIDINKNIWSNL